MTILLDDHTRRAHIERITDLATCLDNRDDLCAENMARNLSMGVPAYWYRGWTNAASYIVEDAGRAGSLLTALIAFAERHPHDDLASHLDKVIPLNQPAVRDLSLCYRLQSTFREDAELRDRERQAIRGAVYLPHMSAEVRARWAAEYASIQRRFEARRIGIGTKAALAIAITNVASDDDARAAVEGGQIKLDEVA